MLSKHFILLVLLLRFINVLYFNGKSHINKSIESPGHSLYKLMQANYHNTHIFATGDGVVAAAIIAYN